GCGGGSWCGSRVWPCGGGSGRPAAQGSRGCVEEPSGVGVVRVEIENRLGVLARQAPVLPPDRLLALVKQAVNLALDPFARHEAASYSNACMLVWRTRPPRGVEPRSGGVRSNVCWIRKWSRRTVDLSCR